jgi:monoamine oxidase
MSRTPLFAAVRKVLALASRDAGIELPRTSALTRRRMMQLSVAAAGAAALTPVLDWSAYAKQARPKGPIAIIGGGAAGLTAAYRLHEAGGTPIVFEASNRWGGRMFTVYDFYKGMFCELGGELVDTNHDDLKCLAKELGVGLQKLAVEGEGEGEDLYFFNGVFHTSRDILDPQTHSGAFVPIAKQIGTDANNLTDDNGEWTALARDLDNKSLKAYLEQFRGQTEDWVIDMLDVAYVGEYGLETEEQSSLNLVNFIGTDLDKPFQIFGESDEAWRIKDGSSALINALLKALEKAKALENNKIEMNLGYTLTELDQKNKQIVMSFDAPGGAKQRTFEAAILALPFTRLRKVNLKDDLHLSRKKLNCIRELGMGHNAKIMFGTTSRVWRTPASDLPVRSNGSVCSDLAFQDFWETSRAQPGEAGILTNFLGGNAGLKGDDAKSAIDAFRDGLAKMSPKMAESLDREAVIPWFWNTYPYTLGSYASAKVGQYTTMLEVAGEPALDGRLQFAGEHTGGEYTGYMNSAVASGNCAAAALIKIMALHKMQPSCTVPPEHRVCELAELK